MGIRFNNNGQSQGTAGGIKKLNLGTANVKTISTSAAEIVKNPVRTEQAASTPAEESTGSSTNTTTTGNSTDTGTTVTYQPPNSPSFAPRATANGGSASSADSVSGTTDSGGSFESVESCSAFIQRWIVKVSDLKDLPPITKAFRLGILKAQFDNEKAARIKTLISQSVQALREYNQAEKDLNNVKNNYMGLPSEYNNVLAYYQQKMNEAKNKYNEIENERRSYASATFPEWASL